MTSVEGTVLQCFLHSAPLDFGSNPAERVEELKNKKEKEKKETEQEKPSLGLFHITTRRLIGSCRQDDTVNLHNHSPAQK